MKSILLFLFCVISLIAQEEGDYYYYNKNTVTTPAAPVFTDPESLDSLMFWFASESIWTKTFWSDTADNYGNDDDLYNSTGMFSVETSATLKGKRFLKGTGTSNSRHLDMESGTEWGNFNNWTVFVVDSVQADAVNFQALWGFTSQASPYNEIMRSGVTNATPGKINLFVRDENGVIGTNINSDSAVTGKWGIHVTQWSSQTLTSRIIVSGDTTGTTASNAFLKGTTWNYTGAGVGTGVFAYLYSGSWQYYLRGGIAEIIVYRGYLTLDQINLVAGYLSTKFGLVWNTNWQ